MRVIATALLAGSTSLLAGCGNSECTAESCADICAEHPATLDPAPAQEPVKGARSNMSQFENSLIHPLLEDIRQGVRPFDETSVGMCKGVGKECSEYLGLDGGKLEDGEHMVRAEFRVPNIGERGTWSVRFETECTIIRTTDNGQSSSTSSWNKEYTVWYAGEDRGFRLSPLYKIQSPRVGGRQECSYQITSPHPDGDRIYKGSWIVPEKT